MWVAVYAWRVKPGFEEQFRAAWRQGTRHITQIYGSFGSRLHRAADGRFFGYAEWPDEKTWRAAFDAKMHYDDPETSRKFGEALAPDDPQFPNSELITAMEVTDDLLTVHLHGDE